MTDAAPCRVAVIHGAPGESGSNMMSAAVNVINKMGGAQNVSSLRLVRLHLDTDYDGSWDKIRSYGVVFKAPTQLVDSTAIRRALDLYANITPLRSYKGVTEALRPDIDVVMVREDVEGLFGSTFFRPAPGVSCNIRIITKAGSERVARVAFRLAQGRRKKVTVAVVPHAAIQSDETFLEACEAVSKEFPDVRMETSKPDSICGTLVDRPDYFDVVLAPNDWGFILQDGMAACTGSVGLGPRAYLGDNTALFEPVHGTAPGTVNPISQILAGKMMLEWLGTRHCDQQLLQVAERIERAVTAVLDEGPTLTIDLGGNANTGQVVNAILERAILD